MGHVLSRSCGWNKLIKRKAFTWKETEKQNKILESIYITLTVAKAF